MMNHPQPRLPGMSLCSGRRETQRGKQGAIDMTEIYADKLNNGTIQPDFVDRWKDAFEYAASQFQITNPYPWNPHPDPCPTIPCPPCKHP